MPSIRTVTGSSSPDAVAGHVLMHEHLLLDLGRWNGNSMFTVLDEQLIADEVSEAARVGVGLIVEQTTPDMGRTAEGLARVSSAVGVAIVACTGFYMELTYPAERVAERAEEELAETMIRELTQGIGDSGIRAGLIGEIGTSPNGVTPVEKKVLRASARAQRATGSALATHTAMGRDASEQLDILEAAGADLSRVVVGHMDGQLDLAAQLELLRRGVTLGYDRLGAVHLGSDDDRLRLLLELLERDFVDHIVLSMDMSRSDRLQRYGGHGFAGLHERFLPRLREQGVAEATLSKLLVENPLRLLAF